MTRHRTIFSTLLLLAAFAAVPSSALAGTLLSGYGAPGGGAQAILGSALVNGPGSGGGGAAGGAGSAVGGAGGAGSAVISGGGASVARLGRAGGGQGVAARTSKGAGAGTGIAQGRRPAGASAGASSTYTSTGSPRLAAGLSAADDMGALGFTGTDLLLLVLVLGVLAITTDLTRRLAGTRHYR